MAEALDLTGIWYGVRDPDGNICTALFMFRPDAEKYQAQCEFPTDLVVINLNGIVRRNTPFTGAVR